jgi:hypothetical protein
MSPKSSILIVIGRQILQAATRARQRKRMIYYITINYTLYLYNRNIHSLHSETVVTLLKLSIGINSVSLLDLFIRTVD